MYVMKACKSGAKNRMAAACRSEDPDVSSTTGPVTDYGGNVSPAAACPLISHCSLCIVAGGDEMSDCDTEVTSNIASTYSKGPGRPPNNV